MALTALLPHGLNASLVLIVGFFLRNKLKDIECRIVRMENTFFNRKDP